MTDLDSFKNQICAVIVTFHPDEQLKDRVDKILRQSGNVVLVDNNSSPTELEMIRGIVSGTDNCFLIENGSNLGIAEALNRGVNLKRGRFKVGYCYLIQDTVIYDNLTLIVYMEVYTSVPRKRIKLLLIVL
jgi:GT2 family glycosyltransferase